MAKLYQNTYGVDFMVWEVNPKLREKNNVVKIMSADVLSSGDMIVGANDYNADRASLWVIDEVIDVCESVFGKGKKIYTCTMQWQYVPLNFFDGKSLDQCGKLFTNMYSQNRRSA